MIQLGDLTEDQTVDFKFSTVDTDNAPITLAGSPVVKVYKGNADGTEVSTGVTLIVDFDSTTGMHHVRIVTTDAFYAVANDYQVVITAGTVDGISVVGTVLACFSIENRFMEADMTKILGTTLDDGYGTAPTFDPTIAKNMSIFFGSVSNNASASAYVSEAAGIKTKTDYLPSATAGAAGGVLIAGSNAATTVNITGNLTGNVTGSVGSVTGVVTADMTKILGTTLDNDYGTSPTFDPTIAKNMSIFFGSVLNDSSPSAYVNDLADIVIRANRIPNVAAGAAGGLFIAGSNAATTVNITGNLTGNVSGSVGSVTGAVGSVAGHTPQSGDSFAIVNSGTHGLPALKTLIDAVDDLVDSEVGAIKTKTDYLPSATAGTAGGLFLSGTNTTTTVNFTGNLSGSVGSVSGHTPQTGDAYAIVASGTHGNSALKTLIDTIDNFLDTEITGILEATDTEISSILALLDDPRTEPGQGAPPVNPDLATKIDYIYKAWRNKKTQNATLQSIFADDGSTVDHKRVTSDVAGTTTVGEVVTGP